MGGAHDKRKLKRLVDASLERAARDPSGSDESVGPATDTWRTKWSWVLTLLGLSLGIAFFVYQSVVPIPSRLFLEAAALVGMFFLGLAAGFVVSPRPMIATSVSLGLVAAAYFPINLYIREMTKPSFAYVLPGVVVALRADAPIDSWEFFIYHYGPKNSENVKLLFKDAYKIEAVIRLRGELLNLPISALQTQLDFGDVAPDGAGHLGQLQFPWTPLTLDHERYQIAITAKDRNVFEYLDLERQGKQWTWHMRVIDQKRGDMLLNCRYGNFPGVREDLPHCNDILPGPLAWREEK